ncbi:hypothetical protein Sjap_020926 [Stephania japonica]|uniref:Fibrillarin n=1 Tax=Stephania japonica TaxID=461633 RepID=A0AAP0F4C7_9MAGN
MRPPRGRGGGGGFRGRSDGGGGRGRGFGGRGGGEMEEGEAAAAAAAAEGEAAVSAAEAVDAGKEDALVTKNMAPGEAVYGEKRISVQNEDGTKVEYRVWNPFRSKLASAVLSGLDEIFIVPGAKVLYLGAASGTSVSHVSDIIGPARILALNASYFLKNGGHYVISIKANCIDSTVPADAVFASEVNKLRQDQLRPLEQITLEPYERDHACVVGLYRAAKKKKADS